ncbi:hypothetical protein DSO57_1027331 [Entomophthora muscae]|uniref:Uncharacterized protein n=1 Tax=Entomophthora muscae TaxID=34485 RepID=A0ACC2T2N5_9FUNG|nr:hypothetical protein DSO57_1027331 [Entomophthora muscae]
MSFMTAIPLLCYPDSQEIEEDQLHRILNINAYSREKRLRKEPLIAPEALTHESDSAKKKAQILILVNVLVFLETFKGFSPTLCTALVEFLRKYKDIDVYQVMSLVDGINRKDCTYINMMVHKVKVRATIDSVAPGNIISS